MQLTNFHLGRRQKEALKVLAQANGSNVAEELRKAVDAYLVGITPDALALLDAATRQAAGDIAEMTAMLEATNRKADAVFAELERLSGRRASDVPVGDRPMTEQRNVARPRKAGGTRR